MSQGVILNGCEDDRFVGLPFDKGKAIYSYLGSLAEHWLQETNRRLDALLAESDQSPQPQSKSRPQARRRVKVR